MSTRSWSRRRWTTVGYAAFGVHAGAVALLSGPGQDRIWGIWAVGGYTLAALLTSRSRTAALAVGLAGALVGPVIWLHLTAPATPDVVVVARAAALVLHTGTPYLPDAQLTTVIAYNPYLPVMSVFGLPGAVGLPGVLGDPRVWLSVATVVLLAVAFRLAGRSDHVECALFALASSVLAFPLTLGITDPPMLALLCLAAALLGRHRWGPAALTLGVACAMKATAWPALPVFAALVAARDGTRATLRFTGAAAATTVALVAACAPAVLAHPASLLHNTILFPLGLTRARTPAASPLPGHLLASTGPAGHLAAIGVLAVVGIAYAVSLVSRPPADARAAIRRLAIGMTLLFALAPATRFGYFAYPVGLFGWLALSPPHGAPAPQPITQEST